jgi:hypothetical protein
MHHAASRKNTSFSRNCLRNAGRGWSMIVTVKEAEDTVKMCLYIYINNIFLSIKNLILIRALANNKKKKILKQLI